MRRWYSLGGERWRRRPSAAEPSINLWDKLRGRLDRSRVLDRLPSSGREDGRGGREEKRKRGDTSQERSITNPGNWMQRACVFGARDSSCVSPPPRRGDR